MNDIMALSYLLFGAGSSLIVDYEEAIQASGRSLSAIVRNYDVPDRAIAVETCMNLTELTKGHFSDSAVLIPLFTPGFRYRAVMQVIELAEKMGARVQFETLAHPSSVIASSSQIGQGSFINAGGMIGAASQLSDHCIVNRGASIGHHTKLEEFVSVGPGAILCGEVTVKRGAVIGAGAVIYPKVEIGENSVVAAGSVVSANVVASRSLVRGNPARPVGRAIKGYGGAEVPSGKPE